MLLKAAASDSSEAKEKPVGKAFALGPSCLSVRLINTLKTDTRLLPAVFSLFDLNRLGLSM